MSNLGNLYVFFHLNAFEYFSPCNGRQRLQTYMLQADTQPGTNTQNLKQASLPLYVRNTHTCTFLTTQKGGSV